MSEFLGLCFIILNLLDVTSTKKILSLGGREDNPIVRFLMKIKLFIPIKILVTLFLAAFIVTDKSGLTGFVLCGVILLFVINNYIQLYLYYKEN